MAVNDPHRRLLIALTEDTPVARLWQVMLEHLRDDPTDVCALFVIDERWHRAASLPGTLEISRVSGAALEFTRERADQLCRAAADRVRRDVERMATESRLRLTFDVLSEISPEKLREFLAGEPDVVIASSHLKLLSAYSVLESLQCHVILVDEQEPTA
jgi:hypothetical protein